VNNWAKDVAGLSIWKEDGTLYLSGNVLENGDFDFVTGEPGRYVLRAWRDKAPTTGHPVFYATRTIVVERAGETGVELDLEPAGTIDVTLQENVRSPASKHSIAIRLRDTSTAPYLSYQGDQNGIEWFSPVPPGSYWLTAWTEAPFCVDSVRMDGADIRHGTVNVTPGAALHMDVSLSDQCATIQGKVANGGNPAPFSKVVLLLSGTPQSPGEMVYATSNETGAFSIGKLPPGQYLLWAWPLEDPTYTQPASLAEVAAQATAVSIGKGQRVFVQVPQLNGKERQ